MTATIHELNWTMTVPNVSGWWWLEYPNGTKEEVTVWSPDDLQAYDPDCDWESNTWYMESVAYMGWIALDVARGCRWAKSDKPWSFVPAAQEDAENAYS